MKIDFAEHGSFTLTVENNVIVATLNGSWNKEAAVAYKNQFMHVAQPLIGNPWGHIVYLDEWELCEAEMFQVIIPLVTWCIDNGLQKAAHIYSKSAIKKHFLDQMVVERHGDFERCIFTSKTEAADWLAESDFIVQR
jgi:hypothetical protein